MVWERLAHVKLTSASATIDTASDTSFSGNNFAGKRFLHIVVHADSSSQINCRFEFNQDTDSNYVIKESESNGSGQLADFGNVDQSNTDNITGTASGGGSIYAVMDITNHINEEKMWVCQGMDNVSGVGTAPERKESIGKWDEKTEQITRIEAKTSSNTFSAGSHITVWGSDGADDTSTTGIQDGTIYEESDTGKHKMWNATTSTWTEIA